MIYFALAVDGLFRFGILSAYGNREDGGADALSWMLDRRAFRVVFFDHPVVTAEMSPEIQLAAEDVDKHYKAIQDMCMFQWPAKWTKVVLHGLTFHPSTHTIFP